MAYKACIIAIGSEITSGEVTNSNAAWIAEQLEQLGFAVVLHLAVPDDRARIQQSLDWATQVARLIVITGGLGPTSDDFTREEVARWLDVDDKFDEKIWLEMNEVYRQRGQTIREAHRQQCHFPANTQILTNQVGTAHGFMADTNGVRLVVLPGPPREIQAMWEGVKPSLQQLQPQRDLELHSWTCFGVTESEAAEVTEKVMQGSGLLLGYRASIPYVKVKVWAPPKDTHVRTKIDELKTALAAWVVAEGPQDPGVAWMKELLRFQSVVIRDEISGGRLSLRLTELEKLVGQRPTGSLHLLSDFGWATRGPVNLQVPAGSLELWLDHGKTAQSFVLGFHYQGERREWVLELPFKINISSGRGRLYLTEMAIMHWAGTLKSLL